MSLCPGRTGANWTAIHAKNVDFLDRWADQAPTLAWTTLDLYGVHPAAGTDRVDFCAGLVMSTDVVSGVTGNRMGQTNTTFYRDKPGRPAPCHCGCL